MTDSMATCIKQEPQDPLNQENPSLFATIPYIKNETPIYDENNLQKDEILTNPYQFHGTNSDELDDNSQCTAEEINYYGEYQDLENHCKICNMSFMNDLDLQDHFRTRRLGEKSFQCCACMKTFRDNTQLNVHARKHTGEQPYECELCKKRFSVQGNLNKHMRIHSGVRPYECFTCERKFTQLAHLDDHIKTHSNEKPFGCDECSSRFKTKSRLRKHKKSHEEIKVTKKSVQCVVCMKMLKSARQLPYHMVIHTSDPRSPYDPVAKVYKCSVCSKMFKKPSQVRRHENSHKGLKPYNCDLCTKTFPSAQNLKRHMMTHTGIKPYSCTVCGKGFLTLENMTRHNRIHTGEKPYSCDICGRTFAHSTTAKEHRLKHTGVRPFQCKFCEKNFTVNKLLLGHIKVKHPEHYESERGDNRREKSQVYRVKEDYSSVENVEPEYVDGTEFEEKFNPHEQDQSGYIPNGVFQGVDNDDKAGLNLVSTVMKDVPSIKVEQQHD